MKAISLSTVRAKYSAHAKIVRALAHPTRLFVLDELSKGERTVSELTRLVGVEMATVSRHLSQLKNVGIIQDDKRGAQVFYSIRARCALKVFECVQAIQAESQNQ